MGFHPPYGDNRVDFNEVKVYADSSVDITTGGLISVDGVVLSSGDFVLLGGQTTTANNGPMMAKALAWTRPSWYATGSTFNSGHSIIVQQGTVYGDSFFATQNGGTVGTTNPNFVSSGVGKAYIDAKDGLRALKAGDTITGNLVVEGDFELGKASTNEGLITLHDAAGATTKTITFTKWADLEGVNGLVKCNGSGDYSAAQAGTDYAPATGSSVYVAKAGSSDVVGNFTNTIPSALGLDGALGGAYIYTDGYVSVGTNAAKSGIGFALLDDTTYKGIRLANRPLGSSSTHLGMLHFNAPMLNATNQYSLRGTAESPVVTGANPSLTGDDFSIALSYYGTSAVSGVPIAWRNGDKKVAVNITSTGSVCNIVLYVQKAVGSVKAYTLDTMALAGFHLGCGRWCAFDISYTDATDAATLHYATPYGECYSAAMTQSSPAWPAFLSLADSTLYLYFYNNDNVSRVAQVCVVNGTSTLAQFEAYYNNARYTDLSATAATLFGTNVIHAYQVDENNSTLVDDLGTNDLTVASGTTWESTNGIDGAFQRPILVGAYPSSVDGEKCKAFVGDPTSPLNIRGKSFHVYRDAYEPIIGEAALTAGTVTVNNTKITADSKIFLTVSAAAGTQGFLSYAVSAGTSFTITSTSNTDTSTVSYLIVEPKTTTV